MTIFSQKFPIPNYSMPKYYEPKRQVPKYSTFMLINEITHNWPEKWQAGCHAKVNFIEYLYKQVNRIQTVLQEPRFVVLYPYSR